MKAIELRDRAALKEMAEVAREETNNAGSPTRIVWRSNSLVRCLQRRKTHQACQGAPTGHRIRTFERKTSTRTIRAQSRSAGGRKEGTASKARAKETAKDLELEPA